MSLLQTLVNRVLWWRHPPRPQDDADLLKFLCHWESTLLLIQHVLVWQNPLVSLICVSVFNIIFWTVVWLKMRFYGLVLTGVTIAASFDCARHHGLLGCVPQCSFPSLSSPSETSSKFRLLTAHELHYYIRCTQEKARGLYSRVLQLREHQPGIFCALLCGVCLVLSVFGAAVSFTAVIYFVLMSAMTFPAVLVRFPGITRYLPSFTGNPDADTDEYLPDASEETIRILSLQDESPFEAKNVTIGEVLLYPDLHTIQSYEHSLDCSLEPDGDIPSPRCLDGDSESSEISEPHDLHFKKKHFNGNASSSSSGDDLSRGLRFRGRAVDRQSSSDSSESFELISKDDL